MVLGSILEDVKGEVSLGGRHVCVYGVRVLGMDVLHLYIYVDMVSGLS